MVVEPSVGCCSPSWGGGHHEGEGFGEAWSRWLTGGIRWGQPCTGDPGREIPSHEGGKCDAEKIPCTWETLIWCSLSYTSQQFFYFFNDWKILKQNFAFCLLLPSSFPNGFLIDFRLDAVCRSTQPLCCSVHSRHIHTVPYHPEPWKHWAVRL